MSSYTKNPPYLLPTQLPQLELRTVFYKESDQLRGKDFKTLTAKAPPTRATAQPDNLAANAKVGKSTTQKELPQSAFKYNTADPWLPKGGKNEETLVKRLQIFALKRVSTGHLM